MTSYALRRWMVGHALFVVALFGVAVWCFELHMLDAVIAALAAAIVWAIVWCADYGDRWIRILRRKYP